MNEPTPGNLISSCLVCVTITIKSKLRIKIDSRVSDEMDIKVSHVHCPISYRIHFT